VKFKLFSLQLKRAFKLPWQGDSRWQRLLVGALLWALPMVGAAITPWVGAALLLPTVILTGGYCLRVMRYEVSAPAEQPPTELPPWTDWPNLVRDGIWLVLLALSYLAGLAGVMFLAWLATGTSLLDFNQLESESADSFVNFLFIFVAILLICEYFPLMVAHIARTGDFKAGYDYRYILKRILSNHSECYQATAASILLLELSLLAIIVLPLLPLAVFAAQMISSNLWAQAYKFVPEKDSTAAPK
jgi:hypothetical protein